MLKRLLWSDRPEVLPGPEEDRPNLQAACWEQSVFPLGNGQLGCTVFGDPRCERVQFNEDSLWIGNEDCTGAYQPFGDVYVELPHESYSH